MSRIETVSIETAEGPVKAALEAAREQYGGMIPGIYKILLVDLNLAGPVSEAYKHLNLREGSPLSKVQREMIATVVNGLIGANP